MDAQALANAEEQLRLKQLSVHAVGATALKLAQHEAKIEGRKLSIMEKYRAMKKDLVTKYGEDYTGTVAGGNEYMAIEATKKGEITTFFTKYAEGLDKSLKATRELAEWTEIWNLASQDLKDSVIAAQEVYLRNNAWGAEGLTTEQ